MTNLKPPPMHQWVTTQDGSQTLFSERFEENCHSTHGAFEETLFQYILGCQIPQRALQYDPLNILEVGFGLGMGFLVTLQHIPSQGFWNFVSLEIDVELVNWFQANHPEFSYEWYPWGLMALGENFKLFIVTGDALTSLKSFLQMHPFHFHAIYQDAFSPKKNPSLWTKEWFSLLKEISHPEVLLSTYSSSVSVRLSLLSAGWGLKEGGAFGQKKSSTRANLQGESDQQILDQFQKHLKKE
jgi:tRNA U34 5-methylaminomethyl-2-thiouridine-forming methyltransferase MnmC